MRFTVLLLCMPLLYAGHSSAQYHDVFTAYGIDQGLPQVSVWSIAQDKAGFLWVATADGAARFDGYKFKVYRHKADDPKSISGGTFLRFYTDSANRLWAIGRTGICLYNEATDDFRRIFTPGDKDHTVEGDVIFGEDKTAIWAGFSRTGLVRIDKATLRAGLIPYTTYARELRLAASGFVSGGKVWIGGLDAHCYVFDIAKAAFSVLRMPPVHELADFSDTLALATTAGGLMTIDKRNGTYKRLPITTAPELGMKCILRNAADEVIVAGYAGVLFINTKTWRITHTIKSFDAAKQTSYVGVRSLYKDKSGNIWIGTDGDGLKMIAAPRKPFALYSSFKDKSNLVKSIYADSRRLYVGYAESGVDIFDRETGFLKNIGTDVILKGRHVSAIVPVDEDHLLLNINDNNVVYLLHLPSGQIRPALSGLDEIIPGYAKTRSIRSFFSDVGDTVFTGFADCLLAFPKSVAGVRPKLIHQFKGEGLTCAFRDSRGVLWCGTGSAIFYMDAKGLQRFAIAGNATVKTVNEDADGNIWVGTTDGIYVFGENTKLLQHYTDANGLSNNFIYGILRDDNGNMWFSHNKGLTVFKRATHSFRHYIAKDGLQSNEFNTGAYFKAADGTLFFGGINGTNAFNPREISDNLVRPVVRLTDIQVSDAPYKTDTAYWKIQSLNLPYNENSLSFEFAALEFTAPEMNRYAYIMQGVDKDWINAGDKRFARYARLAPGHYIFKVKASNNDNVWGTPTAISITIVPPYWERIWFRILLVLLFAGGIAHIILQMQKARYRRKMRAIELQQKIQLERERISRDLHDNVGTQLSLISNNIEWLDHPLKPISAEEKAQKLRFVNGVARDIIATLRETIWALKKEEISLVEFSDRLKAFVQKQAAAHQHIQFAFSEAIDGTLMLGPSEALNLFRICQEAIANALKHSGGSALSVTIKGNVSMFSISVADNGKGFDESAINPDIQNGLENMKFRAQEIGAELRIEGAEGGGVEVRVLKNGTYAV